jgi:hypothetical protein
MFQSLNERFGLAYRPVANSSGRVHKHHSNELACATGILILQPATLTFTITAASLRKNQSPVGAAMAEELPGFNRLSHGPPAQAPICVLRYFGAIPARWTRSMETMVITGHLAAFPEDSNGTEWLIKQFLVAT